ncbi:MAG: hypothetical protein IKD20_07000 [Clostridia bacterium]|nr:hypothetical protein [Clostridia bacterium]
MTDFNKYGIFPKTDRENSPKKQSFLATLLPIITEMVKIFGSKSTPTDTSPPSSNSFNSPNPPSAPPPRPSTSPSLRACRDYLKRHDYFVSIANKK